MENLNLIKDSFESWYNKTHKKDSKVSVVINYSDEQTLLIKAYHQISIRLAIVGIKNGLSYMYPLISVEEHYNHGVISEEDAKEHATKTFLNRVFEYCSSKQNVN